MKKIINNINKSLWLNFYSKTNNLKSVILSLLFVFTVIGLSAQTVAIQKVTPSGCYYYSGASKTTYSVQVGWSGLNSTDLIRVRIDNNTSTQRIINVEDMYDAGTGSAIAGPIVTPQVVAFEINADGASHTISATIVRSNSSTINATSVAANAPSACIPMPCTGTNLGGVVFLDNNADGVHQVGETQGIENVTVTAFDKNGATYAATSDGLGRYAFSIANSNAIPTNVYPLRVEFTNFPSNVFGTAGPSLNGNKSSVRFVSSAQCNLDCGGVNPINYSQSNPPVFSNIFTNNNPLGGGSAGTTAAIITHPYLNNTDFAYTTIATASQVGTVWAKAWNKYSKKMLVSAFLKRHSGLGPLGLGGLYVVDYSVPATPVFSNMIDLTTIGIDFGQSSVPSNTSRGLGSTKTSPNRDLTVFGLIGKVGIGNMDLSENGDTLFVMNLYDKKIYKINLTAYFDSGTLPTASNVSAITIPSPSCVNGALRPFALKVFDGKLYAGMVCDASTGTKSDLVAYVKALDLSNYTWSDVFDFPLTYPKGYPDQQDGSKTGWYPWSDVIGTVYNGNGNILYPVPMLSDIEFDLDGTMVLALMDRTAHQMGNYNYDHPTNATSTNGFVAAGGDILRAFYANGAYVLENAAKAGPATGYAPTNNQGPGFGEFYNDNIEGGVDYHTEMLTSGLALLPGSGEVMAGMVDPSFYNGGPLWANGPRRLSNSTGLATGAMAYYTDQGITNFGKANGMGDLELACDNAVYLEVGNYVWKDLDRNGIQDPAETGVSGVVLRMYKASDGTQVATATTDANGNYYFSTLNGQTILPNTNYKILAGVGQYSNADTTVLVNGVKYKITLTNIGQGTNAILNDNNFSASSLSTALGSIPAGIPFINLTTGDAGYVNHTIDLGLYALPGLGDTVWNDLNKNGLQDVGETPFQNLKVYLLNALGNKIDSTTTNSNGYYQFINLQPSVYYQVQFTSPGAVYTQTLQNVGADDNDDSDIDALLKTQFVSLTWNEFNKTLDAGFYACTKPNAGSNLTACGGTCINISGTTPTSGLWSAMGTNPTGATLGTTTAGIANVCFTNASTGTYNFIYFTGGCSDTMNIVVAAKPNAGTDKSVCINSTATMNATGSGAWTAQVGNPTAATITTPTSATSTITGLSVVGTYNFIWTVGSCTDTVSIIVNALPTVSAGSPFTKTCTANTSGAMIGETNDATATYAWSPALGLSSTTVSNPTANPSATTTYTVTKTNTTTGCSATASILVTVNNAGITVSAGSPFTKTCTANTSGAMIGESNDATATYAWSPALGLSSTTVSNPTANPSATTTYTVTKTNTTTGCTATANVLVTVNNAGITVSAGSPFTKTCTANTSGATIGEANESGNTYSWSPALGLSSTTVSNPTANPSATTTYTVTKTNTTTGCSATASVLVTVNNAGITVSAGSPFTKTCTANTSGAMIGETNDATATYAWSPALGLSSTTVSNPTANPSVTTTYSVTKTNTTTGCTATANVLVTVNNAGITVSAGSPFTKTCTANTSGAMIGETNDATATYAWSPALGLSSTTVSNPTANPSATTTYTVTKTNTTTGCSATANVLVTVNNAGITVSAGSPFTKTCTANTSGATIGEANESGNTYSWSPATGLSSTTVSNPTANPSSTTTYTVTKTNTTTGCTATANVLVTVNNAGITVSAGSPFTKTCTANTSGAMIGETNDATATYAWSPALGLSSTTVSNPTANPSATTTYTVTKTNTTTGCTATASVLVTVNNAGITVSAGSPFTKTCTANTSGAMIGESNDATATYSWSPALGLSSTTVSNPTANPSVTTTYTVTKTNTTTGCTVASQVTITVNTTLPIVSAGTSLCVGSNMNITPIINGTWASSNNAIATVSNAGLVLGVSAGNVNFTFTNTSNGCSATTTSVLVNANTSSTTTENVCITNMPYTWNGNSYNTAGTYLVHLTNSKGCDSAATLILNVVNASVGNYVWSDINNDGIQNEPASAGLNGVVVDLYKETSPGIYTIVGTTITANNGSGNPGYYNFIICSDGNYKVKFPTTNAGKGLTILTATAGTDGNNDANTSTGFSPIFTINTNGTGVAKNNPTIDAGYIACNISLSITATNGTCSNSNLGSVTSTVINGVSPITYLWNNAATTANIVGIATAGNYSLTVTDNNGCSATSNTVAVTITPCCNVTDGGVINGNQSGCGSYDPSIIGNTDLPSGGVGTIEYVWIYNLNNVPNNTGSNGWVMIPGANGATYDPGVITQTTYYIRCARRVGCSAFAGESNIITKTVNQNSSSVTNISVCASICSNTTPYIWNGHSYTTSGTYLVHLTNSVGCDSAATLNLTIITAGASTTNVSVCNGSLPYTWNGNTYNVAGTYNVHISTGNGCDSIATLVLTVANPVANFTYSKNCKNEVTFVNTSTNATDYEWIIGDRTICTTSSINTQTLHSDVEGGTNYTVTLIAKNNSLCYDTMTQIITIYPPAITVFSADAIGCTTKVKFNNFTLFGNSYTWDFGVTGLTTDTSTLMSPTYTYPANGTYNVSLISSNTEGCGDTLTIPVVVNSNGITPTANFTVSDVSNVCAKRYNFTNTSTNAVSYQWIFADGSMVNTVNASKSFATAGIYAVMLVAQSSTGCFDTLVQNVNVIGNSTGAVASFGVNNSSQCLANNSFEFYNTSVFMGSGWIPTYNWDFGDGTFDNTNSSVYNKHYATPGIYTIRVIAIGTDGCRDTAYQSIEVLPSPIASFTANTSCGMTALINNQTTGAIANIWHFGTGYYEENNNAAFSNTYHHENWYNISLIAIGANGCKDVTDRGVFPTRVGAPLPNFTYDTLGCSNAIKFHNISTGGASASWNFGDGSALSTNFNPTHVYTVGGTYTVTLTLSNGPFCSAVYSMLVYAPQGYNVLTPHAGLTYQVAACSNTITASDTSLNSTSRNWYFDGVLVSTTSWLTITNPTVGGHELKLVVTNGTCYDTLTQFIMIQATPISVASHQLSSCSRTVVFSSQATSGNTYNWNFNDSISLQNTTEGSLVSHTFSANGTYYVTLTSTNLTGCTTSTIDTVVVNAGSNPINAAFKFNNTTCNCVCNNKILFTNLSSGAGNTYLWNFGDGTSTTQANPNKGFAEAGTYNVTLTAVSPSGCISVASMQVTIVPTAKGPSASFNTDNQVQCLSGNNFSFYNTSRHMGAGWNMKYYWNFGDGTIDTVNTFVYNKHYNAVGTYTVSLVALGSDNCYDTMTMTVQVKNTNCLIYSNNVQVFNQANNSTPLFAAGNTNTGVTEQVVSNNDWNLYPNPNTGTFNIACNKLTSNVTVEVIDILGRKVNANITKNYAENKVEISCTNISTGNYFVIISNGNEGKNTRLKFNITQ